MGMESEMLQQAVLIDFFDFFMLITNQKCVSNIWISGNNTLSSIRQCIRLIELDLIHIIFGYFIVSH